MVETPSMESDGLSVSHSRLCRSSRLPSKIAWVWIPRVVLTRYFLVLFKILLTGGPTMKRDERFLDPQKAVLNEDGLESQTFGFLQSSFLDLQGSFQN